MAAARTLDEAERIEGVIAFVEHSVTAGAAVAAALGLPFVSPEAAVLARDKFRMRRALTEAGIPSPGFGVARSADEAIGLGEQLGYPLVIKPLIGGGSMFTRRIDGPAEMRTHFAPMQAGAWDAFDYDPLYAAGKREYGNGLLVEAYVDGGEISVESLIVDGTTRVLAVHDKPLPMRGPHFEEIYYRTPSRLPADVRDPMLVNSRPKTMVPAARSAATSSPPVASCGRVTGGPAATGRTRRCQGMPSPNVPHVVLVGARAEVIGKLVGLPLAVTVLHFPASVTAAMHGDAAAVFPVDIADPAGVLELVREIHRRRPVDGVLSLTEHGLVAASRTAEVLGLRGNPAAAVLATQDKVVTRQLLHRAGLDTTAYRPCAGVAEAAGFLRVNPAGIVLKPVDGAGSAGSGRWSTSRRGWTSARRRRWHSAPAGCPGPATGPAARRCASSPLPQVSSATSTACRTRWRSTA